MCFQGSARARRMGPEAHATIKGCDVLLLGTVAGFLPDADRVRAAFEAHRPDAVALGVPPEDLEALERLWASQDAREALAQPDARADRLLHLLGRFGATRIPSPDLEAAYAQAKAHHLPIAAVDLDDVAHTEAYVRRVKVRHLWRAPKHEARLLQAPFTDAKDAYDLATQWDALANHSRPLRHLESLREDAMAKGVADGAAGHARLLAVVPAPRLPGVAARIAKGL